MFEFALKVVSSEVPSSTECQVTMGLKLCELHLETNVGLDLQILGVRFTYMVLCIPVV